MVGGVIYSNAVRIGVRRHVLQPEVLGGVDDAQDRPRGHIACGQIIPVVARVESNLVYAADERNIRQNVAAGTVDHNGIGREGDAIVVGAADKEVVARSLHNAGGHAIRHDKGIHYNWAVRVSDSRIYLINGSNREIPGSIGIRYKKVSRIGIEDRSTEASGGNRTSTIGRRGNLIAEYSLAGDDGSMVARHILPACAYTRSGYA